LSAAPDDWALIFRAQFGSILAALMMHTRDISLAEDAIQESFLQATERWPVSGLPSSPGAWLFTVAKRRLFDLLRKSAVRHRCENNETIYTSLHDQNECPEEEFAIPEERLRLIFTCCHPALSENARVALTLKTLCGLSVKEIARAYFSSSAAIEQRLTRAKQKIKKAGIAYEIPEGDALVARLPSVLSVIYLIYNESYSAYEGQALTRDDFALEAIRLARVLYRLLPHSNVGGLLALLLLHDSRRCARVSSRQCFIPLQAQDRSLWDQALILEGGEILNRAIAEGAADPYKIQAAISALHCEADTWEKTHWAQIELLYSSLYKLEPSPVVLLNQAVVVANSGRVALALELLQGLAEPLERYQPFYAARADLAHTLGLYPQASSDYLRAIKLTKNCVEIAYLENQHSKLAVFLT